MPLSLVAMFTDKVRSGTVTSLGGKTVESASMSLPRADSASKPVDGVALMAQAVNPRSEAGDDGTGVGMLVGLGVAAVVILGGAGLLLHRKVCRQKEKSVDDEEGGNKSTAECRYTEIANDFSSTILSRAPSSGSVKWYPSHLATQQSPTGHMWSPTVA